MKTMAKVKILGLILLISLCCLSVVNADDNLVINPASGTGPTAQLNFQIVIPSFIYFRVGTVGSVDTITYSPTVAQIQAGATLASAAVPITLLGNVGDITITEVTGGALINGGGDTISFSNITTTDGAITAPALSDAVNNSVTIASALSVINLTDNWTYNFDTSAGPWAAGTYNGTVTYTAAAP